MKRPVSLNTGGGNVSAQCQIVAIVFDLCCTEVPGIGGCTAVGGARRHHQLERSLVDGMTCLVGQNEIKIWEPVTPLSAFQKLSKGANDVGQIDCEPCTFQPLNGPEGL